MGIINIEFKKREGTFADWYFKREEEYQQGKIMNFKRIVGKNFDIIKW